MNIYPKTHQDLFLLLIDSRRVIIWEFSGDIEKGTLQLRKWAAQYAADHNLEAPADDEAYGIYKRTGYACAHPHKA
jgi:hypothetical protein